ncbi:TetR/AcrR family transcriptional regulator [Nocardiopsis aegyptia]|uniref:AcrR family transcriptional regulator n=1 Tax=Nocardiopsis aegyptia TaxID=220378 RepID=A0A7Z0JCN8_9ACTN|nr:TetR family transcriptional regulator [Nocardiopsis aegyptia]NYJ37157.1 AcrR family transcriptional regulator [Nocardiopsis aegyptia]
MTNLVDRPSFGRGQRRRDELVDAGLDLLAEGGWPAVTVRAVAARSGANAGLIHYHFGGLPALHLEIARRAGDSVVKPVVEALLAAPDARSALDAMRRVAPRATGDERALRLAVELMAGMTRRPELGDALKVGLHVARGQIADWLGVVHPQWPTERRTGVAMLVAALIDGITLHRMLDAELSIEPALTALAELIGDRS